MSASESGAYYQSRDCKVTTTGADWLYEYTNIWAILTDSGGNSSSSPSHLLVRNGDSKPCSVKVTASPVYSHPDDPVLLERIVIQNAGNTLLRKHRAGDALCGSLDPALLKKGEYALILR